MKHNVKITLLPEVNQVQLLIDTIDMYSNFCNYISGILHKLYTAQPINKHYIKLVEISRDLQNAAHREFPAINHHLIPLAFRKVTKYYKHRPTAKEAYVFSGVLDCSSPVVSIKSNFTQPNNIGMLTIQTLVGPQEINFTFNEEKRDEVSEVFRMFRNLEFILFYNNGKFYLSTLINDDRKEQKLHIMEKDPFRIGRHYL